MKKLSLVILAVLFVSAMSASASWWWPFGKKAAEPAKEKAAVAEVQKSDKAAADQSKDKAKCEAKKAEKKAKSDAKKAEKAAKKEAKKAKKAEKAVGDAAPATK